MLCTPTRGISIARSIHIRNLPHRKSIVLAFVHQYRSFSVSMSSQAGNRSYSVSQMPLQLLRQVAELNSPL